MPLMPAALRWLITPLLPDATLAAIEDMPIIFSINIELRRRHCHYISHYF